jgi:hypothetical protein
MSDYPEWICADCGRELASSHHFARHAERNATFHQPDPDDEFDVCGWCGSKDKPLTEPRDYGYPSRFREYK